jgi:hypothetical protein
MSRGNELRMRYEKLKKAILKANIVHADVALRALDRIDRDQDFRHALEAVVVSGDAEAISKVVYAHFEPEKPRSPHDYHRKEEPIATRYGLQFNARELAKLINDRALEICTELLSDSRIEGRLQRVVERHFEGMILAIIGVKRGSFNDYEVKSDSQTAKKIRALVEEKVWPIVEAHFQAVDFEAIARKVAEGLGGRSDATLSRRTKEYYQRCVEGIFEEEGRRRAQEIAKVDALAILDEHFEDEEELRGIGEDK